MNNTMEYRGYTGSVEFSEPDGVFFGELLGIRSLVSYEGETVSELEEDFRSAVEDYLELCRAEGLEPEKPYGEFNISISPELYKKAANLANSQNITFNRFVEQSIEQAVNR